jgi:Flp pilus assembly protein TadG
MNSYERNRQRGQALVEFSLAVIIFLILIMAVVDLGRGIYMYNGVSQAAREIARVTSVHPGTDPTVKTGWSSEMAGVVDTQQNLIPSLADPTIVCRAIDGVTAATCLSGNYVQVTIAAPYRAVTPLLGLVGTWNMTSVSLVQIEQQVGS